MHTFIKSRLELGNGIFSTPSPAHFYSFDIFCNCLDKLLYELLQKA
jgi:hypothetical protein